MNIYGHGFYVMVEGLLVLPFVSFVVLDRRMFGCYFSVLATLAKGAKRGEFWVKWGQSRIPDTRSLKVNDTYQEN